MIIIYCSGPLHCNLRGMLLTYFRIASTSMTRESSGNRRSPDKEVCCPAPWTSSHRACCSSIWDSGTRRAFPAFWKHSAISSMR